MKRTVLFLLTNLLLDRLKESAPSRVVTVSSSIYKGAELDFADLQAERLLKMAKAKGSVCDIDFHEKAVQAVARALKSGLKLPRRVTHYGIGQAKVEKVGSNRRYLTDDGRPAFGRTSATRDDDDFNRACAPRALMKVSEPGDHFLGGRISLHLRRINQHIRRVMAPRQNVQDVAQRRSLRRSDDADSLWQRRDWLLS